MDNRRLDHTAVHRLCNGNREALEWVQLGRIYMHEGDDLIDEDVLAGDKVAAAKRAARLGAMALRLYTHPFFLKNIDALKHAMLRNFHNYRDSVIWENSDVEWQRQFSDWARHGWLEVCMTVGEICGGYDNVANESLELRTMSYVEHHSGKGEPE